MAPGLLKRQAMIDVALSILALVAGGVALELFAGGRGPLVNAEELALGSEAHQIPEEFQCGNPS